MGTTSFDYILVQDFVRIPGGSIAPEYASKVYVE